MKKLLKMINSLIIFFLAIGTLFFVGKLIGNILYKNNLKKITNKYNQREKNEMS